MNIVFKILLLCSSLFIFTGCINNKKEIQYINEGTTFKLLYPKLQCSVVIDLSEDEKQIQSMYSTCLKDRLLKDVIVDFNNLMQYYKLDSLFQESHNISLVFTQDSINFPNFISYYNAQLKEIEDILKFNHKEKLNVISSKHLKKLGMAIKKSNLYDNTIQQLGAKECIKSLDFSQWLKDKNLVTVPKAINKILIENMIIDKNLTNYHQYPHIEYLPINIRCNIFPHSR